MGNNIGQQVRRLALSLPSPVNDQIFAQKNKNFRKVRGSQHFSRNLKGLGKIPVL